MKSSNSRSKEEIARRYFVFLVALFVISTGVSTITRAMMGNSPISGVPYVVSINFPLTMGTCIFLLNLALIIGQALMLGPRGVMKSKYDIILQIPISILFGFFIDLTLHLIPDMSADPYYIKVFAVLIGTAILALGVSLEVVADVTMVSGEYFVHIASRRFNRPFSSMKMIFDCSLVLLAVGLSFALSGTLTGVREGTIIVAVLTGPFVRLYMPHMNPVIRWESRRQSQEINQE